MARQTPGLQAQHAKLAPLSSRYIDVPSLPWQPTRFPGVEIKVLMARLGEVERLAKLDKLPFGQKVNELTKYLDEAKNR